MEKKFILKKLEYNTKDHTAMHTTFFNNILLITRSRLCIVQASSFLRLVYTIKIMHIGSKLICNVHSHTQCTYINCSSHWMLFQSIHFCRWFEATFKVTCIIMRNNVIFAHDQLHEEIGDNSINNTRNSLALFR